MPKAKKYLETIESLVGIAPASLAKNPAKLPPSPEVKSPEPAKPAQPKEKPAFRTNIKPPTDAPVPQPR